MQFRDDNGKIYESKLIAVPFISVSNSAGLGNPLDDYREESIEIPADYIVGIKNPFVIIAKGDSMSPLIEDGDILVCDNIFNGNPQNGDVISIVLNGERLVKYYYMNHSGIFLSSLNKNYNDIYLTEDDEFFIEGIVCRLSREINVKKLKKRN